MEAYTDFASVYDIFMDSTPYEEWAEFLVSLIEKYGVSKPVRGRNRSASNRNDSKGENNVHTLMEKGEVCQAGLEMALSSERNLVLDLGCGTGTLTELLYQKGYDMVGVDNSGEMLQIAINKKEKSGSEILYLCQDMRELDLYSTVGTVVCVCDSVNYLLEDGEVEETFALINNYLYPGGIFIFDFNTVYKYETVIGDVTIAENREECSFIWENYYHEEEKVNEYDLTFFVKEEGSGLFRRFTENHYQRGYTIEEMTRFVKAAGMEVVLVMDADSHKEPDECSERIYVVCRECRKRKEGIA